LATIAVSDAKCAEPEVPTYTFAGKTLTVTETGGGGAVIVSVTLADLVVSVSDVAVIVTMPPVGTMEGAVYVVLNVCWLEEVAGGVTGLNEPQTLEPQDAVKITPELVGSLVTWALTESVVFTCNELGTGVAIKDSDTPIGDATIVRTKLVLCEGLLVTVAIMVIALPIGTADGAV
jgi:hypothetical protein